MHHIPYDPSLLHSLLSLEASIIKVILPVRDRIHEKWKCAASDLNSSGVGGTYCVAVPEAAHKVEEIPNGAETGEYCLFLKL